MALIPRNLRIRGFESSSLDRLRGESGSIFYDKTNKTLRVSDGQDIGGEILATRDWVNDNLFSGSYDDLSDKPTLFSGSYDDLSNKPTLFSGSYDDLSDKPTLFSGSYDDLSDKPVIPSLAGYATETYVNTAVSNLVDTAPETLNTLNELAAALNDDSNFVTTITDSIATKWTQDNTKISNWDTAYGWGDHADAGYAAATALSTKQDTLISGTNIKTINGSSLLGSGNLTISGSTSTYNIAVGFTDPVNGIVTATEMAAASAKFYSGTALPTGLTLGFDGVISWDTSVAPTLFDDQAWYKVDIIVEALDAVPKDGYLIVRYIPTQSQGQQGFNVVLSGPPGTDTANLPASWYYSNSFLLWGLDPANNSTIDWSPSIEGLTDSSLNNIQCRIRISITPLSSMTLVP